MHPSESAEASFASLGVVVAAGNQESRRLVAFTAAVQVVFAAEVEVGSFSCVVRVPSEWPVPSATTLVADAASPAWPPPFSWQAWSSLMAAEIAAGLRRVLSSDE